MNEEVSRVLAQALGVGVSELDPIGVACHSKVYRAKLADGREVFVKCARRGDGRALRFAVRHADSGLVPRPLFDAPVALGDLWVSAFEFRRLRHVRLEDMSDAQFESFCDAYRRFSSMMQGDRDLVVLKDYRPWWETVRRFAAGSRPAAWLLRPLASLDLKSFEHGEDVPETVVHWDLHAQNYAFDGDRLTTFLDFDNITLGSAVDDLAFTVSESIHLRSVAFLPWRRRRLLRRLAELMRRYGRPVREWEVALNRARLRTAAWAAGRHAPGDIRTALSIAIRDFQYRMLLPAIRGRREA